jgi:hypothetical protein
MKHLASLAILGLLGCSPAAPSTVGNTTPTAPQPPRQGLDGPRAVIEHQFLHAPISVINPTREPILVSTATGSLMLVTIRIPSAEGEAQLMLSADGSTDEALRDPEGGATIESRGNDAELVWWIARDGSTYDFQAIRRGTGVFCGLYAPEGEGITTKVQVEALVAACRDIRVATEADATYPRYSGG